MELRFVVGVSVDLVKWGEVTSLASIAAGEGPVRSVEMALESAVKGLAFVVPESASVIIVTEPPVAKKRGRKPKVAAPVVAAPVVAAPVAGDPPAKRRGRPRKVVVVPTHDDAGIVVEDVGDVPVAPKRRGRPRKAR